MATHCLRNFVRAKLGSRLNWGELRALFFILLLGLSGVPGNIARAETIYITQEGDRLSKIVGQKIQGPVWGEQGSLKPVLSLNPQIKDPNLIFPGQKIQLPVAAVIQKQAENLPTSPTKSVSPEAILPLDQKRNGRWELLVQPELVQINITDRSSSTVSNLIGGSFHFQLGWLQPLNSSLTGYVRGGGSLYSFAQSTTDTQLSTSTPFIWDFSMGVQKQLSSELTLSLDTHYREFLATSPITTTLLSVDKIRIPEAGIGAKYAIQRSGLSSLFGGEPTRKGDVLGVGGSLNALLPGTTNAYTSSTGIFSEAFLYYEPSTKKTWGWNAQIGGSFGSYTTTISQVTQESIGVQLSLNWGTATHTASSHAQP